MSTTISIYNLAQYFDKKLDELPENLRKAVEQEHALKCWDSLSLAQRGIEVQNIERQQEDSLAEKIAFKLVEINRWLDEKIDEAKEDHRDIRRQALNDVKEYFEGIDFYKHAQNNQKSLQSENRERESLLKIILALAKNSYKYPYHGCLKEIVEDFERNNNGVSEKTLKKYLDEADRL